MPVESLFSLGFTDFLNLDQMPDFLEDTVLRWSVGVATAELLDFLTGVFATSWSLLVGVVIGLAGGVAARVALDALLMDVAGDLIGCLDFYRQ